MRLTHRTLAIAAISAVVCGCSADRAYTPATPLRSTVQPAPRSEHDPPANPVPRQDFSEPPMVPPAIGVSRIKRVGFLTELREGFSRPVHSYSVSSGNCGSQDAVCGDACVPGEKPACVRRHRCGLLKRLCFWKRHRHPVCRLHPECAEPLVLHSGNGCGANNGCGAGGGCGELSRNSGCGDCGLIAPDTNRQLPGAGHTLGARPLTDRLADPFVHDAPPVADDTEFYTFPESDVIPPAPVTQDAELQPTPIPVHPQSVTSGELPLWPRRCTGGTASSAFVPELSDLSEPSATESSNVTRSAGIVIQPALRAGDTMLR
ncbi:MAG: hypothetical protein R3C19_15580 [Planctomycetaceae bacterium]